MRVGATWPSTVSVRNLYHWSQLYQKDRGLQVRMYMCVRVRICVRACVYVCE